MERLRRHLTTCLTPFTDYIDFHLWGNRTSDKNEARASGDAWSMRDEWHYLRISSPATGFENRRWSLCALGATAGSPKDCLAFPFLGPLILRPDVRSLLFRDRQSPLPYKSSLPCT
ncbi:hypothetical protein V8F44DRAFT_173293 [Aspergillus fumigatus]